MTLTLRLATPKDRAAIESVVEAAYTIYIERIGGKPGPMLDDRAAQIAAQQVHLAKTGGAIMGLLVLIPDVDYMLLDNVAVAPAAQGTGVGRFLLEAAERLTREAGFSEIRLYTNAAMTENLTLYPRIGYHETHRITEKGFNRVYFAKPL